VSKERLIQSVWTDTFVSDDVLTRSISELRRVFGDDPKQSRFIQTIPKGGYRVIAQVVYDSPKADAETRMSADDGHKPYKRRPRFGSPLLQLLTAMVLLGIAVAAFYVFNHGKHTESQGAVRVRSIAVLPFKPLVATSRDESLEFGMADSLITRLGNLKQIIVRPISAVRNYGGLDQDPVAAGHDLGVEAVLDASIQTSGEKIRLSARLLSVSDGSTLWAYQCDEQHCTDIFTTQDVIAEKITGSLTPSLAREETRLLSKHYTDNRQAFQLYSIGRFIYNKWTPEGIKKSVEYYQKAIDLDPNYALAYSGMADSYNSLGSWFGEPVKESGPKAKAAAMMALKLDETLAEAHASLGKAKFLYDWDWAGAEQELKRAIELNPNCAEAHSAYSVYLSSIGRPEEALAEARRGQELDPFSIFINHRLERRLYYARQYDQAIKQCQKILEIDPNFGRGRRNLATIYLLKGMNDEAVAEFEMADRLSGSDPEPGEARLKAYKAGGIRGYLRWNGFKRPGRSTIADSSPSR